MKGLIRNNFYNLEENILLSSAISGVLIAFIFFTGESDILMGVTAMQVLIFILNVSTVLRNDEKKGWNKLEVTLPTTSKQIVGAKYFIFCALILLGVISSCVTVLVVCIRGIQINETSFKGVLIGIEMGLMIIAIMYPITLKKSAEKSEMILVIATMISTAIWVAIWSVCNHINIEIEALRHTDMILLSAAVLMFFGSFFVSSSIQKSKEFR